MGQKSNLDQNARHIGVVKNEERAFFDAEIFHFGIPFYHRPMKTFLHMARKESGIIDFCCADQAGKNLLNLIIFYWIYQMAILPGAVSWACSLCPIPR